jgi:DNA-binding PadR family transcriptional regulator
MWNRECGPRNREGAGRGWEWKGDMGSGPFWFGFGPRRGGPRGGRMFEQGDLKLVILQLLADKPRHGYEIIKELEERSGGRYSPSPGTVYPTLTLLEDMGYAVATPEESGKKVYAITEAGRGYLADNRSTADEVLERLSQVGASLFGEQMRPAHEAMAALGRSYFHLTLHRNPDAAFVEEAVAILRKAAGDLDALVNRR